MMWHTIKTQDVLIQLSANPTNGLTSHDASKRLEQHGQNTLEQDKPPGILKKFLNQFNDYMIIILLAAAAISIILAILQHEHDYVEPAVILLIVLLNAIIGVAQEYKAERALDALKSLSSPTARVLRDGGIHPIVSSQLVPGDIIELKTGDYVPADARILSCNNLQTDEAALTGESHPVEKNADAVYPEDTPVADMHNMLWASTAVTAGNGRAVITETGMRTQAGKIARAILESESPDTPLQLKLANTGKVLGTVALFICGIVFIAGVFRHMPAAEMFMTSVSLAVAAIPEGLPAIVTVMLALGVQRMAQKNAIVRKLPAVETLGSASVICSDKTGTLTQNKMTVVQVWGDTPHVLSHAVLCSNGTDATEQAIIGYAQQRGILAPAFPRVHELPFSSATKYMMTVHRQDDGFLVIVKGAPDVLLEKCKMTAAERAGVTAQLEQMTAQALRVIAVATATAQHVPSAPDSNLRLCGLIGLQDPPRPEIAQAVKSCKKAGIRPVMITGDHVNTAVAIGKKIGIANGPHCAVTGAELNRMSDRELTASIPKFRIFARVTPEHKVRIVKAFQRRGEVVAMTGDGVNDAPALKQADIGCAMGITGTDVAKGASDMILTDDNFATIVEAVQEGRCIFANIKKAVHFLLSSNIGEILTIFCAIMAGLPSPLSAVQLLWVNLITDSLPAVALGVDSNNRGDIMAQKPVDRRKSIFADGMAANIFLEGLMIGTLSLLAFCTGYFQYGSAAIGRTMAFCVLSLSQLFHAFNVRSGHSVFSSGQTANRLLYGALLLGIVLQVCVVTMQPLSTWFATTALTVPQWRLVALLSVAPIPVIEVVKFVTAHHKPYE